MNIEWFLPASPVQCAASPDPAHPDRTIERGEERQTEETWSTLQGFGGLTFSGVRSHIQYEIVIMTTGH